MDRGEPEHSYNIISADILRLQLYLINRKTIDEQSKCWLVEGENKLDKYRSITYDGEHDKAYHLSARAFMNLDDYNIEQDQIEVCHRPYCPYKACFNPRHIYIGTQSTNRKDYWNSKRISPNHCIYGHELVTSEKTGRVYCKQCSKRYRENRFNSSRIKYSHY